MSFGADDLLRLAAAEEVEIETEALDGSVHRTIIWVVVDGADTFIRSFRGPAARWYVQSLANPAVAIHVDGRRLAATAIAATDPDSIERVSAGMRAKYPNASATESMATAFLETTLRLEPT